MPSTDVTYVALSDSNSYLWWGAVIGGFVVVLAVAALLTILVLEVRTHRPAASSRFVTRCRRRRQHRRHRADREDRQTASKPSWPKASSTICSSDGCSTR